MNDYLAQCQREAALLQAENQRYLQQCQREAALLMAENQRYLQQCQREAALLMAENQRYLQQCQREVALQIGQSYAIQPRLRLPGYETVRPKGPEVFTGSESQQSDLLQQVLRTVNDAIQSINRVSRVVEPPAPGVYEANQAPAQVSVVLGSDHALTIPGLRKEPATLSELYGPPVPCSLDNDEETILARSNQAYDWLLRFEVWLRRFIDDRMTRAFGVDWPKHRLNKKTYDQWKEKKAKDPEGTDRPLIAYADFTDYAIVICRSDNWRDVFAPFYGREESVRESFQRLYPICVDTMHARPINPDDGLLLYLEIKRLVKATSVH